MKKYLLICVIFLSSCGGASTPSHPASGGETTYAITPTADANGTISPSRVTNVASGGIQNFTMSCNSGYSLASVTVDGSSVAVSSPYKFSNVTTTHTITFTCSVLVACAYGSAFADGCPGSPVGGNVQHADFFTSRAKQSGQSYVTRPPWNVAGVDYPVGIPSGTVLKDPTTAALPSGCSYSSNVVTCSGSGNLTVDGYDFGLHNCVFLDIYSYTGTILIQNNNFEMGSSAACQTNYGLIDVEATTSGSSLIVQNNVFNDNAPTYPTAPNYLFVWDVGRTTGASLYQYNAFLASIGRPIETTSGGDCVAQYNYFEGLNYGSEAHGEIEMIASAATNVNFTAQFNTSLNPADYGGGATALWYVSAGQDNGQTFGTVNIKNNTSAINLYKGLGGTTMMAADTVFAANPVTTANILNNYIDPTGLLGCYSNGTTITTINMYGNINLLDGSSISDFEKTNCHGHH